MNFQKGVGFMGLIRAAVGAAGGTMADQWKEFFYCEAMDKEVMVVKGTKRTSSRSSNKRGSDNISMGVIMLFPAAAGSLWRMVSV